MTTTRADNIIPFARGYRGRVHYPLEVNAGVVAACGTIVKRGWQMTFLDVNCKHCLKVISDRLAHEAEAGYDLSKARRQFILTDRPRAMGCLLCIEAHPIDETTDCNCGCGHTVEFVVLGGTWYEVSALDRDNPYTKSLRQDAH